MPEYLHKPETANGWALVLTHGAGANANTPLLVKVAEAFAVSGFFVLRYNLPFRQRKPFGPPHPSTAQQDRDGLREAVRLMKEHAPKVCIGGHSYGGRQASMLAAEEPGLLNGLLLLSYPLHPPNQPQKARTAHLPTLRTPALFVHGEKDDFGTEEELQAAMKLIPGRTKLNMISGAGHDLKKGAFDLEQQIVKPFLALTIESD